MGKFILGIAFIVLMVISIRVWASTVTTTDGKNFIVTNDVGASASYTMNQINIQVASSNQRVSTDQQILLKDSEVAYTWVGVQQMAVNSYNSWESNQVNESSEK